MNQGAPEHGKGAVKAGRIAFAVGVLVAIPALIYLRDFTVDDALITARYAWNIAHGRGYRFNPNGPSTDGVTPLGVPYLLAPFAAGGPLAALRAARVFGALAWLAAAGALGVAVGRVEGHMARYASLIVVFLSAPLAAWASAGLETGWVIALATLASVLPTERRYAPIAGFALGLTAWLRPEMIAFAGCLAVVRMHMADERRTRVATLALALGPWCATAAIRAIVWGRAAPLAVLSKPSDFEHGASYALWAIFFTGVPMAVASPLALTRLPIWPRALIVASTVHFLVVALAGGDWMPLARLMTPVLPSLVLATAYLLAAAPSSFWVWARLALACMGEVALLWLRGPAATHVLRDRLELIEAARPVLRDAARVATIDVGWVGAATERDILDLAGATDPEIAALPGGHTSKAIPIDLLFSRSPDLLVFEERPRSVEGPIAYSRAVEIRLSSDTRVTAAYRMAWESPAHIPVRYVVLSR